MASNQMRAWPQANAMGRGATTRAVLNQLMTLSFWCFCAFVFFLVAFPSYGELKIGGSPNLAPSRLFRFAMLGLMTLIMMIKPFRQSLTSQNEPGAKLLYRIVVAFWLWLLPLVMFNALSGSYTVAKMKNEVIPVWISFWLTVALVRNERQVVWLLRVLAGASVIVLGVMVLELVLKRNVFDGLLQVENLSTGIAFMGEMRDGRYRAKATFQHALVLAHFFVSFGLLFTAMGIFHPRPFRGGLIWWVLGLVCLASVFFTNTRSGLAVGLVFLGLLLCLRFWVWLKTLRSNLMAAVLGLQLLWIPVLASGLIFIAADIFEGRTAAERSSSSSRLLTIYHAVGSIVDSPLIGYGVGLGETKGGVSYAGGYLFTVDNLFLLEALDNGLPAALLLLACFGYAAWRIRPAWRTLTPNEDTARRIGLLFMFATTIAMYSIYALSDLFELCFVLVGATLCMSRPTKPKPAPVTFARTP